MADSREVRASAFEVKFVVGAGLAPRLRQWARANLEPDPHGGGPHGDQYVTTSLYLDTAGWDVFHRRGSYGRSKYRIRRYGEGDTIFLERKLREPTVLAKRRTPTGLDTLTRLDGQPGEAWAGGWFHERLSARRLRPVCQVSYARTARLAAGETLARMTLDEHLAVLPADRLAFTAPGAVPVIPVIEDQVILELKFRYQLPAVFRRLVETFALQPSRASKYRLGMSTLVPSLLEPRAVDSSLERDPQVQPLHV